MNHLNEVPWQHCTELKKWNNWINMKRRIILLWYFLFLSHVIKFIMMLMIKFKNLCALNNNDLCCEGQLASPSLPPPLPNGIFFSIRKPWFCSGKKNKIKHFANVAKCHYFGFWIEPQQEMGVVSCIKCIASMKMAALMGTQQ